MKYQAFIFDMDGTIINTIQDIGDSVNYSLQKHGFPLISYEECTSYLGDGSVKLIQRALHDENSPAFQEVFDTYYNYYMEHFCVKTKAYPHLIPALKYASSLGILLFVYTNKPQDIANIVLKHCFGDGLFEKLVGIPLGGKTKPSPDAFWEACKEYHLDYSRCAYFGDSVTDIKTAYNLGVKDIYSVLWGYQSEEKLRSVPIERKAYLKDPSEIEIVAQGLIL
ncbi:MAG: HAD family hydrolase [Bacilli bacterium]|nr:HAD family hydrolase [Bacilli bacterium]